MKDEFKAMHTALLRYSDRKGWTPRWATGLKFQCARWINHWNGGKPLSGWPYTENDSAEKTARRCVHRGLSSGVPRYLEKAALNLSAALEAT